jgi:hypothetical protein
MKGFNVNHGYQLICGSEWLFLVTMSGPKILIQYDDYYL